MIVIFRREGNIDLEYWNSSSGKEQDQERPEGGNMTKVIVRHWSGWLDTASEACSWTRG